MSKEKDSHFDSFLLQVALSGQLFPMPNIGIFVDAKRRLENRQLLVAEDCSVASSSSTATAAQLMEDEAGRRVREVAGAAAHCKHARL